MYTHKQLDTRIPHRPNIFLGSFSQHVGARRGRSRHRPTDYAIVVC